jgi:hypothetical protein
MGHYWILDPIVIFSANIRVFIWEYESQSLLTHNTLLVFLKHLKTPSECVEPVDKDRNYLEEIRL